MTSEQASPQFSVVIEGYNQSRSLGLAADTLTALRKQTIDLDEVEVILVGSAVQRDAWESAIEQKPFRHVRFAVAPDDAHYLELKNLGAEHATGDLVAMTDSDAFPRPEWLEGALRAHREGAAVSVGISFFARRESAEPDLLFRLPAASMTWGWILGRPVSGRETPVGLIDHNVVFRRDVLRELAYHTDHGRVMGGPRMLSQLRERGVPVAVAQEQRDVHSFAWPWWFRVLFRFGFEVYTLRRIDPAYPNPWIARTGPIEPLVTMAWHMLLDVPRWFRFCRVGAVSPVRRVVLFPLLLATSFFGRCAEMLGMFCTLLVPVRMRRWAKRF